MSDMLGITNCKKNSKLRLLLQMMESFPPLATYLDKYRAVFSNIELI